jgi:hypothetical protein
MSHLIFRYAYDSKVYEKFKDSPTAKFKLLLAYFKLVGGRESLIPTSQDSRRGILNVVATRILPPSSQSSSVLFISFKFHHDVRDGSFL